MDKATIILTIISLFLALVSLVAIVLSIISYKQSVNTALKVSSKEHEMSENLKYEVPELIAVLRAFDAKADIGISNNKRQDYSYEIESLRRLQLHPEFLLFLKSIQNDSSLYLVEEYVQQLTMESTTEEDIRFYSNAILRLMKKQANLDDVLKQIGKKYKSNWCQLINELCDIKGHNANYYRQQIINLMYMDFVSYLFEEKHKEDSMVRTLYESIKNCKCEAHELQDFVLKNCKEEYANYLINDFCAFIVYMVETRKLKDPKILQYYSKVKNGVIIDGNTYVDFLDVEEIYELFEEYHEVYFDFSGYKKSLKLSANESQFENSVFITSDY